MNKISYRCHFAGCATTNLTKKHLYRFPKDEARCKLWVEACQNSQLVGKSASILNYRYRICEDHFAEWCFMNITDRARLVPTAVPEVNKLPILSNYMTSPSMSREMISPNTSEMSSTISNSSQVYNQTPTMQESINLPLSNKSSTGRKKYTPRKNRMAKLLKNKNDLLRKLKAKTYSVQQRLSRGKKPSTGLVRTALTQANVNSKLVNFILRQVTLNSLSSKSRRFTKAEKIFDYSIMCKGKGAYTILRSLLALPSESTLRRFIASKLSKPGMNYNVISSLKHYAKEKPLDQRLFALVFDEMSLKPKLIYNAAVDNVAGFEDFGELGRSQVVANQALVFMIKNIKLKRKLPICYYISNGPVSSDYLKIIIDDLIEKIEEAGIIIKAIICDQSSTNCRLFSLLGITPNHPFFEKNGRRIFGIYDPPHLLKTLRRNLMKYDLETSKGLVSFKHISKFFIEDQKRDRKLAPKLTEKHVFADGLNSMKVSLAAQVFSNSVSAGMSLMLLTPLLSAEAAPTAEFVGRINDLFDSTNGTSFYPLKGKLYHCVVKEGSPHISFWEQFITDIQQWKFISAYHLSQPPKKRRLSNLKSQLGWLLTLNSLRELYDDLKDLGFKFMIPHRFNQDCLENFFSCIRNIGGHNKNPSVYEFSSFFKIASVNNLTRLIRRKSKNCEDDDDKFLTQLIDSSYSDRNTNTFDSEDGAEQKGYDACQDDVPSSQDFDFIEKNVLAYLAGYVAHRALAITNCEYCKSELVTDKDLCDENMYIYFKEYISFNPDSSIGLKYPSKLFFQYFCKIFEICDGMFKDILHKDKLFETLKQKILEKENFELIGCSTHKNILIHKVLDISIKLAIKIHLRELNRSVSKKIFNFKKFRETLKK